MAGVPAAPPSKAGFEVVRRGYDQSQVETHLRRLDADIRILVADRDAAADQSAQLSRELDNARVHAEELRAQVRSLTSQPQSVQGMSDRMRSMLRLAEDEVGEMLSRTESQVERRMREADLRATQIVAAARAEADAIRAAARIDAERASQDLARARGEFDAERRAAREKLAAVRAAAEQRIATADAQAEQKRARAWTESEARRTLVEEDFAVAMNQRRSEALAGLRAEQLEAHRQIEEMRESTTAKVLQEADRVKASTRATVTDAERRVAELVALRNRLTEQIESTRTALTRSLEMLAPPPKEATGGPKGNGAARPAHVHEDAAAPPEPTGDGAKTVNHAVTVRNETGLNRTGDNQTGDNQSGGDRAGDNQTGRQTGGDGPGNNETGGNGAGGNGAGGTEQSVANLDPHRPGPRPRPTVEASHR